MFNIQPKRRVPGLHNFRAPEELVPGFRMNADGTVRQGVSSRPDSQGYPQFRYGTFGRLRQDSLEPLVPMPPLLKVVPVEPPVMDWPERGNRLGIPEHLMRDPDWQPSPEWHSDQIQMDPHGRVLPRQVPWPWRRPDQ